MHTFFRQPQGQVINIPDVTFKAQLLAPNVCRDINGQQILVDANANGQIEVSEALNVYTIYFQMTSIAIQNLTGIEYFTNLKAFYASDLAVASFDATPLANLEILDMYDGYLSMLNLSGLSHLKTAIIHNNNLTTLNLTGLTALETLQCSDNNLTTLNVSGLTSLKTLSCLHNQLTSLNLQNLPNFNYVRCDYNNLTSLLVAGVSTLTSLSCVGNELTSLNLTGLNALGQLDCSDNHLTALNVTQSTLLRGLYCDGNNLTSLNLTGQANLDYLYCNNNQITALSVPAMPQLVSLRCDHNLLTSLTLHDLPVVAEINCNDNQLTVLNLTGINNNNPLNTQALGINCSNNQLASIDLGGTLRVNTFQCVNNQLTALDVSGQPMYYLNCSDNQLTTIDVSQNTGLQNFVCNNNNPLTTIFMKNGKLEASMQFSGNPNLQYICADDGQLAAIQTLITTYGYTNCHTNAYCSFVPGGVFYTIQGSESYDADNNGCTALDGIYPNLRFSITNGTTTGSIISDASGTYSIPVQAGSHTVSPIFENPSYFTVSPSSVGVGFPSQASPFTQQFCIAPNGIHNDLEVVIIPLGTASPGFNVHYKVVYRNKGTHAQSGQVSLGFNDALMDFAGAVPANTSAAANTLAWDFSNLNPFESREIDVTMHINAPTDSPAVNAGDVLSYVASVNATTDETPSDNTITLNDLVFNSFDPNDKTCLEGATIAPSMVGKDVHYKVRFENNGTANAQNIVVKDEIDPTKFDINTLVPIDASHNFTTRITGNKVEFIFANIQLPFDDAHNDGFVVFKIKTKPTLALGNTLSNTAAIYFDYNFPIITNTAVTTIAVLAVQDFELTDYLTLYPNPAKNTLNIHKKTELEISSIAIYNVLGQLVIAIPNAQQLSAIDVSSLKTGNYFIKINSDKGTTNAKFAKN